MSSKKRTINEADFNSETVTDEPPTKRRRLDHNYKETECTISEWIILEFLNQTITHIIYYLDIKTSFFFSIAYPQFFNKISTFCMKQQIKHKKRNEKSEVDDDDDDDSDDYYQDKLIKDISSSQIKHKTIKWVNNQHKANKMKLTKSLNICLPETHELEGEHEQDPKEKLIEDWCQEIRFELEGHQGNGYNDHYSEYKFFKSNCLQYMDKLKEIKRFIAAFADCCSMHGDRIKLTDFDHNETEHDLIECIIIGLFKYYNNLNDGKTTINTFENYGLLYEFQSIYSCGKRWGWDVNFKFAVCCIINNDIENVHIFYFNGGDCIDGGEM